MGRLGDSITARVGQLVAILTATALLASCTTTSGAIPTAPQVAATFVGVWENVVPEYHNWWVIEPNRVVNYGIALSRGKCSGDEATIVGPNKIEVTFGNSGSVEMSKSDGLLLFSTSTGVAGHRRVQKSDICRKSDGTYYEGAPFTHE
jgi:hypothetical protein